MIVDVALVVLALCLAAATWRVLRGPTDADRVLGVDFGFIVVLAAVALLSLRLDAAPLLDLVLVGTLVGFLATVALARLVARRRA
ncbi:monovalent cation/H+ antiporter complex subunit F [Kineococcus sp. SYSU DK004]|uniref:monovalent cation/H+ antiporter complex subunit F n=1 Tax=Kineococcus sp. SYSU DK004 TaxID=3383125 RepID=UPI003D7D4428